MRLLEELVGQHQQVKTNEQNQLVRGCRQTHYLLKELFVQLKGS